MYTIKNTYEKENADVLLEHFLGIVDNESSIFSDARVTSITWFRSEDRSYGEMYMTFESKAVFDSWEAEYHEAHTAFKEHMEQYMEDMGIAFQRIYLPENTQWEVTDSRLQGLEPIPFEQIFE
jgi:hypothetical protein